MNRRRAILGYKDKGYRRLSYLESTGGQIINTKINPTTNTQTYIDFSLTSNATGMCGFYQANNRYYLLWLYNGSICCGKMGDGSAIWVANYNTNRHRITYNNVNGKIEFDGREINQIVRSTINATAGTGGIALFAQCGVNEPPLGNQPSQAMNMRIYEAIITDLQNNEEVFHGIPCLDMEGRPCLFDEVTQSAFYNRGVGDFLYA